MEMFCTGIQWMRVVILHWKSCLMVLSDASGREKNLC